MFKLSIGVLGTVFLLSACTNNTQPEVAPNERGPFINLSTDPQDLNGENEQNSGPETNDTSDTEMRESNLNDTHPNAESQLEPDPYMEAAENQPQPEDRAIQNTIPHEVEDLEQSGLTIKENKTTDTTTPLPIDNFKERWNAISDEQLTNLYIKSLEEVTIEDRKGYHSQLTNQLDLKIRVNESGYVEQLTMNHQGNPTKPEVFTMLTGWNQIINILHPNLEIYDVDELFNKLGIGPNGDISSVKQNSITFYHITYHISPTENGYTFSANYVQS